VIRSKLGGNLRLRTATPVTVTDAQPKPAAGPNPNSFFATVAAGTPEIADPATLPVLTLRPATTVDFPTTPGATYTVTPAL
jgi:alpha-L-fucosidase 2